MNTKRAVNSIVNWQQKCHVLIVRDSDIVVFCVADAILPVS